VDPEQAAFMRAHTRTFLLTTRPDGSPTGYPMAGFADGDRLDFSTYRRSAKVANLRRNSAAACLIVPTPGAADQRALLVRGAVSFPDDSVIHALSEPGSRALPETPPDIGRTAQERIRSGKRVVVRVTPHFAEFLPLPDADTRP
jgi:hypothetical protein